jgi:hypothetical protein
MAPETGRWLTPDPLVMGPDAGFMAAPWVLHPYQYVNQNPVAYWDPDGNQAAPQLTPSAPPPPALRLVPPEAPPLELPPPPAIISPLGVAIAVGALVLVATETTGGHGATCSDATACGKSPAPVPVPDPWDDTKRRKEDGEVYYRAMSANEWASVQASSSKGLVWLPGSTAEKMVSTTRQYSERLLFSKPGTYQLLVKFTLKPGAFFKFITYGRAYNRYYHPGMPAGIGSWTTKAIVLLKLERGSLNLGFGSGSAYLFNNEILKTEVVPPRMQPSRP